MSPLTRKRKRGRRAVSVRLRTSAGGAEIPRAVRCRPPGTSGGRGRFVGQAITNVRDGAASRKSAACGCGFASVPAACWPWGLAGPDSFPVNPRMKTGLARKHAEPAGRRRARRDNQSSSSASRTKSDERNFKNDCLTASFLPQPTRGVDAALVSLPTRIISCMSVMFICLGREAGEFDGVAENSAGRTKRRNGPKRLGSEGQSRDAPDTDVWLTPGVNIVTETGGPSRQPRGHPSRARLYRVIKATRNHPINDAGMIDSYLGGK